MTTALARYAAGLLTRPRERAFDDLVAWMERGMLPAGDDVLSDVTKLGLRWTPTLETSDPARKP